MPSRVYEDDAHLINNLQSLGRSKTKEDLDAALKQAVAALIKHNGLEPAPPEFKEQTYTNIAAYYKKMQAHAKRSEKLYRNLVDIFEDAKDVLEIIEPGSTDDYFQSMVFY